MRVNQTIRRDASRKRQQIENARTGFNIIDQKNQAQLSCIQINFPTDFDEASGDIRGRKILCRMLEGGLNSYKVAAVKAISKQYDVRRQPALQKLYKTSSSTVEDIVSVAHPWS